MRSLEKLNGPIAANIAPDPNGVRYYRLLVKILDDIHTVYVGNDSTRIFTPDTLPSVLKHRLAIIKSRPPDGNEKEPSASSMLGLFMHPPRTECSEEMKVIGWQSAETMYIVIVSEEELEQIKVGT
jgi:hypothetical protein